MDDETKSLFARTRAMEATKQERAKARAWEETAGLLLNVGLFGSASTLCVASQLGGQPELSRFAGGLALGCAVNIVAHSRELAIIGGRDGTSSDALIYLGYLSAGAAAAAVNVIKFARSEQGSFFWGGFGLAISAFLGTEYVMPHLSGRMALEAKIDSL